MATVVNMLLLILTAVLVTVLSQSTHDSFHVLSPEEQQQEIAELKQRIVYLEQKTNICRGTCSPVDGAWGPWSAWSNCTATCGTGIRVRTRQCNSPLYGDAHCDGEANDVENCNVQPCPIDGAWGPWSAWSNCTATCGTGWKFRTRQCNSLLHGGSPCDGEANDVENCTVQPCPIDGAWGPWSAWSICSATCGTGWRIRTRQCNGSLGLRGGTPCDGEAYDVENCNVQPCYMARSCSELYTGGGLQHNANVEIDTDGPDGPAQPFTAYCEINGTTAYTIIHTVEETETEVNGYENPCAFNQAVRYMDNSSNAVDISQLIPLVDSSRNCRQLVRWRCWGAVINYGSDAHAYLRNRNGDAMAYFGNATYRRADSPFTVMCACGETDSCGAPGRLCHCDANDLAWRSDEGYITHRPDLPVKAFCAGDTGHLNEQGYYVVGPLICS